MRYIYVNFVYEFGTQVQEMLFKDISYLELCLPFCLVA